MASSVRATDDHAPRWGAVARLLALAAAVAGCEAPAADEPPLGRTTQLATVDDFLTTSCDDGAVAGLSRQIADEVGCMAPGALVGFSFEGAIVDNLGGAMPYLSQAGVDALQAAVAQLGAPLKINSGYRTVAAQYLLYQWRARERCDLTRVGEPGTSNHESGRALDVQNYGEYLDVLAAHGWSHPYPSDDPWHFEHAASPDIRGMDVHAFQRLWNRNHPDDRIDEDGAYGAQTEARLGAAPAEGFPIGSCTSYGATLLAVDGAGTASPGDALAVTVELQNSGGAAWQPGTTFLGTSEPVDRESALHHASWPSATRAATVEATTAPGEVGRFRFTAQVAADAIPGTTIAESFGLVEEGVAWFGPADISVDVTVVEGDGGGVLVPDGSGDVQAGCTAGGGASEGLGLGLLALGYVVARRRRSS